MTTDPSSRIAAKAKAVAWICCTPLSWSRTARLSPPWSARPQVTTDPSARTAEKAPFAAWICCTPLSWSRTAELSPPQYASPQVTTDPSSRIAAKALCVAWICCTPLSWSRTAELSPPQYASPQVTTDPSSRIAAKAKAVAWICGTPLSWSRTAQLSPPQSAWPQVTIALSPWHHKAKAFPVAASCGWSTRAVRHSPSSISVSSKVCSKSTRTRFLAVISLRSFFPKVCWAAVLNSWSVDEGRSVRSSGFPFSEVTLTCSIRDVRILTTQKISNEILLQTLSLSCTSAANGIWVNFPSKTLSPWSNPQDPGCCCSSCCCSRCIPSTSWTQAYFEHNLIGKRLMESNLVWNGNLGWEAFTACSLGATKKI